ncbi:4Fe-4S dicluster domain-containing protein [Alkalilimnicola ehrlichii MLHE-1]|uniref:4Fe-4S ferredoxin, iron-sulfur binding domain protein n=1 Tax=Alkalilimnicola ehrlichii (strain ATCC BAA-1101 / DSM 17681 / MLHE-1) TaxID=187272 RepID=Q0A5X0_ALKEH|nr:4Fe-4S ferredoxin, iron-sulfur binding domain protein [Alkalilimnicola ehrlichii MLHE-1]
MTKWGMVIDLEKCTGCQACTIACGMENNLLPGEHWQDVLYYSEGQLPDHELKWLPRPCMQCEDATCVTVCPTGATYKDAEAGGVVFIDWDRCIGCKYCIVACPYGVRFSTAELKTQSPDMREVFPSGDGHTWNPPWRAPDSRDNPKRGIGIPPKNVVSKCTFCHHRTSTAPADTADLDPSNPDLREHTPACVVTCAPGARYFGDLNNPNSQVSKLIAEHNGQPVLSHLKNKPQVYYLGRKRASPSRSS